MISADSALYRLAAAIAALAESSDSLLASAALAASDLSALVAERDFAYPTNRPHIYPSKVPIIVPRITLAISFYLLPLFFNIIEDYIIVNRTK
jgi:hypothetical protein